MKSRYRAEDARRFVDRYAPQHGEDLALRVYTSQLLGQEPALVLHGGGNTSVKSKVVELLGDQTDVLYVKGSGWDLGSIEPRGFPACRLEPLRRACELPAMTDEQMVSQLRGQMIDPSSPTPSVEALLHAFLPAKFIDHTHADAILALVDQPNSRELVAEVLGPNVLFAPYVMPGFALARRVVELWRARSGAPAPTAMVLDKHGIFTWGETAEESYEAMIAAVSRAEQFLHERTRPVAFGGAAPSTEALAEVASVARGALVRASKINWVASWRTSSLLLGFCHRGDLGRVSQIGCATPDHVIRTKSRPLVVDCKQPDDEAALRAAVESGIARYAEDYHEYFRRCVVARRVERTELDPWPRILLFPSLGALAFGRTLADAEIALDIYEHTADVITKATSLGSYTPVSELDLFDVEYWSLEQAKLGKGAAKGSLDGKVAWVTGAASGIGLATARAFLDAGAHVLLTDRLPEALAEARDGLSPSAKTRLDALPCDVTDPDETTRAVAHACMHFGGLDIAVSNAGGVWTGGLHTPEGDAALRNSLELNLLGHQNVARAATNAMVRQGTGGSLLFNASKSAFNQGPDFGPYAVAKAALVALMRQYAVDLGPKKIRSNAINADRIRTGLFEKGVLEERARARGLDVDRYFTANLLERETTVVDVARGFVYLATAEATSGCVLTIDGGNPAAFPR